MKKLKFNSNIKCSGCVAKVKPVLDNESDIHSWKVDLESENRILEIETDGSSPEKVKQLLESVGYTIALIE